MLISDQLNLTARSPLAGPPPPEGYPGRFTDLSDLYAARLRAIARAADPDLAEGVYACLPGPHYETPAEIRMLRTCGADLVGMSTALEAIAARHLGAEVLGISLVTNIAAGLSDQPLDHADVLATGQAAAARMGALLARILPQLTRGRPPGRTRQAEVISPELRSRVTAWIADDPDERDRRELTELLDADGAGADGPRPSWPTGSAGGWSSAPPGCAAPSPPGPTG